MEKDNEERGALNSFLRAVSFGSVRVETVAQKNARMRSSHTVLEAREPQKEIKMTRGCD